jgi:hypothetical protein
LDGCGFRNFWKKFMVDLLGDYALGWCVKDLPLS